MGLFSIYNHTSKDVPPGPSWWTDDLKAFARQGSVCACSKCRRKRGKKA
jgi:hypothetical protein